MVRASERGSQISNACSGRQQSSVAFVISHHVDVIHRRTTTPSNPGGRGRTPPPSPRVFINNSPRRRHAYLTCAYRLIYLPADHAVFMSPTIDA